MMLGKKILKNMTLRFDGFGVHVVYMHSTYRGTKAQIVVF